MEDNIQVVRKFYNENVSKEWERLERHPFEFAITVAKMDCYIQPGDTILDIGGGPGRYSLYYAKKGCQVTLFDLSEENVHFGLQQAEQLQVPLKGIAGDARFADTLVQEQYDHVFLMGPLYHLSDPADRRQAIQAALHCLKPGGKLYVSFIMLLSGIHYALTYMPECILDPVETNYLQSVRENKTFFGHTFTFAYFTPQHEIEPLMAEFPLKKLHRFAQEGILTAREPQLLQQPAEVVEAWIRLAVELCEREDLLALAEHHMYIGEKS